MIVFRTWVAACGAFLVACEAAACSSPDAAQVQAAPDAGDASASDSAPGDGPSLGDAIADGADSGGEDALADSRAADDADDAPADTHAPPDADGGACRAESTGPAPADAGDVTYSYAGSPPPACFANALCQIDCQPARSFVEGLLACDAVQGGYFWAQGSAYVRVHGIAGGACVYDIGIETEGDTVYSRCMAPLPVRAWSGLFYVNDPAGTSAAPNLLDGLTGCVTVQHCDPQLGACLGPDGGRVDAGQLSDTPLCPNLPPPAGWC